MVQHSPPRSRRSSRLAEKRHTAAPDAASDTRPAARDRRAASSKPARSKSAGSAKSEASEAPGGRKRRAPSASSGAEAADGDADAGPAPPPPAKRRRAAPTAPAAPTPRAGAGPTRDREARLWARGFGAVAGVDEAGRGPLAGPVVAAACILPASLQLPGLDDSKKLPEDARDALYDIITTSPGVAWAVSVVERDVIDDINILQATMLAMERAVQGLSCAPDYVLVDGNRLPKWFKGQGAAGAGAGAAPGAAASTTAAAAAVGEGGESWDEETLKECEEAERADAAQAAAAEAAAEAAAAAAGGGGEASASGGAGGGAAAAAAAPPPPAEAVVRGDGSVACIAAASIIAKVTRDRIMQRLDEEFPAYGFGQHKGYGVPSHLEAIRAHGYCEQHRRSFQPIKGMVQAGIGMVGGGARAGAAAGSAAAAPAAAEESGEERGRAAAAGGGDVGASQARDQAPPRGAGAGRAGAGGGGGRAAPKKAGAKARPAPARRGRARA